MRAEQAPLDWDSPGLIAGVDEAGRGPLAGPVVAAAVILNPAKRIRGLADSKVLSPQKRERLHDEIMDKALCCAIAMATVQEIDTLNILQATLVGMSRALCALSPAAQFARIDGNRLPRDLPCAAEAVIGGDALDPAIMAASILAKVARDRAMVELHAQFPQYGFDRHKGYPSPLHLAALREHGPCAQHRRSFAPVAHALFSR